MDSEPAYQRNAELHHYTTWDGLCGIFTQSRLRATHHRYLNDRSEIEHFRDFMVDSIRSPLVEFYRSRRRSGSPDERDWISSQGGADIFGAKTAAAWISAIYQVTYGGEDGSIPFAEPHIVSFCSHAEDRSYERKNGLLSQWRGYGDDSGFAIVFDTQKLENILATKESVPYQYVFLRALQVEYNDGLAKFKTQFKDLVDLFIGQSIKAATGQAPKFKTEDFSAFLAASCRYKHRGFFEEREVRIVACPTTERLRDHLIEGGGHYPTQSEPIKTFHTKGPKPFVELFDHSGGPIELPVTRVIVGPAPDQAAVRRKVRSFLDKLPYYKRVPVRLSETPFNNVPLTAPISPLSYC